MAFAVPSLLCFAQEANPRHIEVYWHHERTLSITGITSVVVFDESICRAELVGDHLRLIGSTRGETRVFVWTEDRPETFVVDVVEEPEKPEPPSLGSYGEGAGTGGIGTSIQWALGSGQPGGYSLFHQFWWQESLGDDRLNVQTQFRDSTVPGNPRFDLNSGTIRYSTPTTTLTLLDSTVNPGGGDRARIGPYAAMTSLTIRGVDWQLTHGSDQVEFFSGITPTPSFLDFTATRAIAGVMWSHALNQKLSIYSTTGGTYLPVSLFGNDHRYSSAFFEMAGVTLALDNGFKLQTGAGVSSSGAMLDGSFFYSNHSTTAFASGAYSAVNFPLNLFHLLPAGRISATAGLTSSLTSRLSASTLYQESSTQASAVLGAASKSVYWDGNLNFTLTPGSHLTGNYVVTHTGGALSLATSSLGQRGDVELASQIGQRFTNSLRTTFGTLSDPFQFRSQDSFSVSDSASLRVRSRDTLFFNTSYQIANPIFLSRLRQDINLLAPELQLMFQQDPLAFIRSPNVPNDLRTLLLSLQPSNLQISAGAQFLIGHRINFSPTAGYFRTMQQFQGQNHSGVFGINLTVQATQSIQLISSLSNVITFNASTGTLQSTAVFSVGLNKTVNTTPRWLAVHGSKNRIILGRVFQDLNVNGTFDAGEMGIANALIQLNDEEPIAADSEGRFHFRNLSAGTYVVRLLMNSMRGPFRVTTPVTATLDLTRQRTAQVNFGIVNFARVEGTIYNDYLLNEVRQPDAPGIRQLRLVLSGNGIQKETITNSAGEFAFDQLSPGEYQLTVDPSTVPANFEMPAAHRIRVSPAQINTQEISLKAMRSVAGHVLYKPAEQAPEQPIQGVLVALGGQSAYTDNTGAFLLRNLPAGKLVLSLIPYRSLEPGLTPPSGTIDLGRDPFDGQGVRILVTNLELAKHLVANFDVKQ